MSPQRNWLGGQMAEGGQGQFKVQSTDIKASKALSKRASVQVEATTLVGLQVLDQLGPFSCDLTLSPPEGSKRRVQTSKTRLASSKTHESKALIPTLCLLRQSRSSDWSAQSGCPLQRWWASMQPPLSHLNCSAEQTGQSSSSLPSAHSAKPSQRHAIGMQSISPVVQVNCSVEQVGGSEGGRGRSHEQGGGA